MLFASYLLGSALAAVAAASPVSKPELDKRQVPVGTIIYGCTVPNTIALTFDDGPYAYTDQVISALGAAGMRATFFLNGQNWASIWDYQGTVQRMINEGHQVGSHTWSHPDLANLGPGDVTYQMNELDNALYNIIGKAPTYMRPPYFSVSGENLQTLGDLGFKVIHSDIDTLDWDNTGNPQVPIDNFNNGVNNGGRLVLAHDVHASTANNVVPAMISSIQSRGLQAVTVGECLGDSPSNWYK